MGVTDVTSLDQWKDLLKDGPPTVAFFWADWHEPSKRGGQMDAVVGHLSEAHGPNALFLRVEAEAVPQVAVMFNIAVVPTFVFLLGGWEGSNVVGRLEGAHPAELAKKLQALVALPRPPAPPSSTASSTTNSSPQAAGANSSSKAGGGGGGGDLNERLRSLVNAAPVMLFMKGSPSEPRCGFSRQMVEVLRSGGVAAFGSFDILQDPEVRQGLKAYSNWPTYPQLYVHGELVGGLDIVKEMVASAPQTPLKEQLGITEQDQQQAAAASQQQQAPTAVVESLEQRLKRLTHQSPVMVFIKGSPDAPRCGFSASLVGLLRDEGVSFGSFDILGDEDVRQGLKTYSNWPTYPQLYVGGELVGGLDIVKEMLASGGGKGSLAAQLGIEGGSGATA